VAAVTEIMTMNKEEKIDAYRYRQTSRSTDTLAGRRQRQKEKNQKRTIKHSQLQQQKKDK